MSGIHGNRYTLSAPTGLSFDGAVARVREELRARPSQVLRELDVRAPLKAELGIDRWPQVQINDISDGDPGTQAVGCECTSRQSAPASRSVTSICARRTASTCRFTRMPTSR